MPSTPLKKQPSKESIHSTTNSGISGMSSIQQSNIDQGKIEEETLISIDASETLTSQPGLIHRNPSVTSSQGDYKLGRIQLTLRYSVARQKLIVVVHKIA